MTQIKEKKYLKDKVVTKLFCDKDCQDYLIKIISKAIGIDFDDVKSGFELVDIRINTNVNIKDTEADVVAENDYFFINVEINYNPKSSDVDYKNISYICQLILRQVKPGKDNKYKDLKPIYQININNYDFYNQNKFIYRTSLMEESCHIKRNNLITIIDINVDFLSDIDYTKIKEESDDSLEKLLYIFVCDNKELLDKVYVGDEIMERVKGKLYDLEENLDNYLWYDPTQFMDEEIYEKAFEKGKADVAINMLKDNVAIDKIILYTGISEQELKDLLDENKHN